VTGEFRFLCDPLINADQSVTTMSAADTNIDPTEALKAGNVSLAVLNRATCDWILKRAGLDAQVVGKVGGDPIPLTNVLGGTGKASA
jgi:hypothetical protein